MKNNRKTIRFTDDELKRINTRINSIKPKPNFSLYCRQQILNGIFAEIDMSSFRSLNNQISRIGNNINQIARALNRGKFDHDKILKLLDDMQDIKFSVNKLERHFLNYKGDGLNGSN